MASMYIKFFSLPHLLLHKVLPQVILKRDSQFLTILLSNLSSDWLKATALLYIKIELIYFKIKLFNQFFLILLQKYGSDAIRLNYIVIFFSFHKYLFAVIIKNIKINYHVFFVEILLTH